MADEPRTGLYGGVHYLVEDGKAWYRRDDVERVLGIADIESTEWLHRPEDDGVKSYIADLADIVDSIVGCETMTMRQLWVSAWYDDLIFRAEGFEGSPEIFGGDITGDLITGLIDENVKRAKAEDAGVIEGLESRIADVRHVADSMGRALQCLQDGVTYLDGFRSGALMASGDVPGMGGIQSLFVDLRGVEDEMSRIHSRLEDIANGGDGK